MSGPVPAPQSSAGRRPRARPVPAARWRSHAGPPGSLPCRDVHFALERCILPSRMTVGTALSSAKCTSRRRGRPGRPAPRPAGPVRSPQRPSWSPAGPRRPLANVPAGPRRRCLSKSVAKAPIEPGRARRIVDIPRFCSRPIRSQSAFATDLDNRPPRTVPGAPPAPPRPHLTRTMSEEAASPMRILARPRPPPARRARDPSVRNSAAPPRHAPGDSPGGPASATPFVLYYAPSPSDVREEGAQRRVKRRSRRKGA